jgi:tripartite-type tricarboxylate transporter receptor subunit TctC
VLAISVLAAATPSAAAEYYEGKTLRLIAATGAGGGVDILARVVARHLKKHIPGNPLIIVQNIPRPTAVGGANYVYNVAKPDGFTIGAASAGLFSRSLSHPGVKFDLNKFTWLANLYHATVVFWMRTDFPCQTFETLKTCSKPLQFGATSRGSTGYGLVPELIRESLGLNMKMTYGYTSREIPAVVERGEIDASGGDLIGFFGGPPNDMMKAGKVRILVQVAARKSPELERHNVPWIMDIITPEYKKLFSMINPIIDLARPYFAPPGIPEESRKILLESFRRLGEDAEFRAAMKRAARTEIDLTLGQDVVRAMNQMLDQPPEIKEKVISLLKGKRK